MNPLYQSLSLRWDRMEDSPVALSRIEQLVLTPACAWSESTSKVCSPTGKKPLPDWRPDSYGLPCARAGTTSALCMSSRYTSAASTGCATRVKASTCRAEKADRRQSVHPRLRHRPSSDKDSQTAAREHTGYAHLDNRPSFTAASPKRKTLLLLQVKIRSAFPGSVCRSR